METNKDYTEIVAEDIVYYLDVCYNISEVNDDNREDVRRLLMYESDCRPSVTENGEMDEAVLNDLIKGQWRLIGLAMHEMGLTGKWLARADAYKIDNLLRNFVFDDAVSEAMRELYVINDDDEQ